MPKETPKKLADLGRRAEAIWIDPYDIVIRDNVRDFTLPHNIQKVEELADNIIAVGGVRTPVIVRFEDGVCVLVDGERRVRASKRAIEKGFELKAIKAIEETGSTSGAERIAAQVLYNSKEDLTHLELGAAFNKLLSMGWSLQLIAEKTNYTYSHVTTILKLENGPESIKQLVAEEGISATQAESLLRTHGTKEAEKVIKAAKKIVQKSGGSKITGKHIAQVTGVPNQGYTNEDARRTIKAAVDALQRIAGCHDLSKAQRIAMDALEDLGVVGSAVA